MELLVLFPTTGSSIYYNTIIVDAQITIIAKKVVINNKMQVLVVINLCNYSSW